MAADFRVRGVGCARRRSECGLKPRVEKPATLRIQSSYMPAGKRHIGYTRAGILFDAYPKIMLGQGGNKPCSQLRTSPAIHYLFHKIYQLAGGFIVRRDTSDVVEQLGDRTEKSLPPCGKASTHFRYARWILPMSGEPARGKHAASWSPGPLWAVYRLPECQVSPREGFVSL